MSFIQIIDYETDRPEEMARVAEEFRASRRGEGGPGSVITTQDRDNPRRYLTIVEFPSYEEAMANSGRPETSAFAAKVQALCSRPTRFVNLDVLERH